MGVKTPPSSLAAAPPALPSSTATPNYPNTSASTSLASTTMPPKVEYPTTAASFNASGSAAKSPLMASKNPLSTAKSPLMVPQKGRYTETNSPASSPAGGFKNPIYNPPASSTPFQKTPLVQNPYRGSVPAIPQSRGSLATAAASGSPYTYSNDPNSRYYSGPAAKATVPATVPGSPTWPKVVSGYPSTSVGSPVATTARAPAGPYPAVTSPINVTAPPNSNPPAANYPITSPAAVSPPSATYQPGANGYQPGATGYQPGNTGYTPGANGYQIPAVRSTAPIQSGSQPIGNNFGFNSPAGKIPAVAPLAPNANSQSQPFRPGSTGSVNDYPWASGSAASSSPSGAYPNTQSAMPLKTSINTSNVMPAGFNQDTLPLRR